MEKEIKPSNIKSFLERFKKLVPPQKKIKDFFIFQLEHIYNIEIAPQHVRLVQNNIYVRTTPIRKTEILKKKKEIIASIEQEFGITGIDIN